MRNVLKRPDFRLLFSGLIFSMTAESVLLLALAIWVKDITGSDGMAGAAILAVVAPMTLAPLIGFLVDRFRRKPFIVIALWLSALSLTPLFLVHDRSRLWIIYAVGVCYGLSFIAVSSALNGLLKEVVPEDLLAEANGAMQTVKQGLRLIAPLAGAGLYAATKGWGLAAVGIAGFVVAAVVLSFLRVSEAKPAKSELHWVAEVAAGVKHLFGTPSLKRSVLGVLVAITVFGFGESVFFAFVDQGLHQPPTFLGILVSAQGVGGLLGGLSAAPIIKRLGEIATVALGILLFLPMLVLGAAVPSEWLAFPAIMIAGFGLPYTIVGLMTLMQRVTPGEVIGRVSAAMDAILSGPQALSIGVGAGLVGLVDYRVLLTVMALVIAAAGAYLWMGRRLTAPVIGSEIVEPVDDQAVGDGGAVGQPEAAR